MIHKTEEEFISDFRSGIGVVPAEYCSNCSKFNHEVQERVFDHPFGDDSWHYEKQVECNGMFAATGSIPCKFKNIKGA